MIFTVFVFVLKTTYGLMHPTAISIFAEKNIRKNMILCYNAECIITLPFNIVHFPENQIWIYTFDIRFISPINLSPESIADRTN